MLACVCLIDKLIGTKRLASRFPKNTSLRDRQGAEKIEGDDFLPKDEEDEHCKSTYENCIPMRKEFKLTDGTVISSKTENNVYQYITEENTLSVGEDDYEIPFNVRP